MSRRNPLRAEIATGLFTLEEKEDNSVTVDMGVTRFDPAALPFDTEGLSHSQEHEETLWNLPLPQGGMVTLSTLAISNPHAVLLVDNIDTAPVATLGPFIESHPRFGNRVNVGFMQVVNRHHIRLRVYERGVGETLSCGTGACAAVATGIRRGLLDSPVTVQTRGGLLTIEWNGTQLKMTGPATTVFSGQIDIDKLVKDFCLKDE